MPGYGHVAAITKHQHATSFFAVGYYGAESDQVELAPEKTDRLGAGL
ncbi:MAG: hypothetical protein IPP37_17240 [Saprospiraceae bacterium]|nr:hypothetical protein [Saprospiraceae bacterium]